MFIFYFLFFLFNLYVLGKTKQKNKPYQPLRKQNREGQQQIASL